MKRFVHLFQISVFSLLAILWLSNITIVPAAAHWADLAVADVTVAETDAQITLTVPTALIAFADDNGDETLSQSEFEKYYSQLEQHLSRNIVLTNQVDEPGTFTVTPTMVTQSNDKATHSTFSLQYKWPTSLQGLTIRYSLFSPRLDQVQCLATITRGNHTRNVVFTPENNTLEIDSTLAWHQQFLSFLKLGVEHIFTGYDHILFLVALLLPGGNLSQLLKIVTAFTIAHSLTLTLAALDIVALPTALVESIIALSIVYVAAENLWRRRMHHRPWLTFGFGLIHGLGFATILQDLTQNQNNLLLSLTSFNLGVELGQVTVVLLVFYGLRFLQKRRGELIIRYGVSGLMVLMGNVWFVERTLGAWL